jgi:hypothetical protein
MGEVGIALFEPGSEGNRVGYPRESNRIQPHDIVVSGEIIMRYDKGHPAAFRTWVRQYLPWFLIDKGVAGKIRDCGELGAEHRWYNIDRARSGCYHCKVVREEQLWDQEGLRGNGRGLSA